MGKDGNDGIKDDGKRNVGDDKQTGKQPADIDPKKYGKK